jgi:hypothetical protein
MEDPLRLHVLGVTVDGQLFHVMRRPEGWTQPVNVFRNALPQWWDRLRGHVTEVAATRLVRSDSGMQFDEGLFVAVSVTVEPYHLMLFRNADTRTWRQEASLAVGGIRRFSMGTASNMAGEFRLLAGWVPDNGRLFAGGVPLPLTGGVSPFAIPGADGEVRFDWRTIAVAGYDRMGNAGDALAQLATVTAGGRLLTATLSADHGLLPTWLDLDEWVGLRGPWRDTAIAVRRVAGTTYTSHIAGVSGDGSAWLTRHVGTTDTWQNLEEVQVDTVGTGGVLIRSRQVLDVGTFDRIAVAYTTEGLHVVAVTTDGRLLHQLEPSPAQQFRDVETAGLGQDLGWFVTCACA